MVPLIQRRCSAPDVRATTRLFRARRIPFVVWRKRKM